MAGEGMRKPVGQGLPEPLAGRLAAGQWLRTAHGGASYIAPDNSRAAIAAAVDLGVDMVEVDARLTADGQLALWHDDEVRAGGVALSIAASPLAALQRLDVGWGERIITLDDAMEVVRGRTALLIDLKADGLARPIVEAVQRRDFAPAAVCGHYWETLREVRRLVPEVGISLTLDRRWREAYGEGIIERIDTDAVTIDWRALDP